MSTRKTRSATGALSVKRVRDSSEDEYNDTPGAGPSRSSLPGPAPVKKRRTSKSTTSSKTSKSTKSGIANSNLIPPILQAELVPPTLETAWADIYQDHKHIDGPLAIALPYLYNHLKDHPLASRPNKQKRNAIVAYVRQHYDIWDGSWGSAPVPSTIIAPYSYLPTITADTDLDQRDPVQPRRCPACWLEGNQPILYIWIKDTSGATHYKEVHLRKMRSDEIPREYFAVQTFHEQSVYRRYFPVSVALAPQHPDPDSLDELDRAALAKYLETTGFEEFPVLTQMGDSHSLKDNNPMLWKQGWPKQFMLRNTADMEALVTLPNSQKWAVVFDACLYLFRGYQDMIPHMPANILEKWVDTEDRSKSPWTKTLATLTFETIRSYSRTFAQLVHLILVTARRNADGTSSNSDLEKYAAFLTNTQVELANTVNTIIERGPKNVKKKELAEAIHNLAVSCLAPMDCGHIAESKYNDITYTYMALKSVQSNGSYYPVIRLARPNSALQYIFRACLLAEARTQARDCGLEMYTKYRKFLIHSEIPTPFSNIKSLRRAIIQEIESKAGKKRLHFTGENNTVCVYLGRSFKIYAIQDMAQDVFQTTKHLLLAEVLFDIPLAELGWKVIDYTTLRDDTGEEQINYSIWNDRANVALGDMRSALLGAFMLHPRLRGIFYTGVLSDGSPTWNDGKRKEWLKTLGKFSLHLVLCCLIFGGQSRRRTELLNMRNHNVAGRERNLFLFYDILVYILGYSKTTAIMGTDRTDVHALPPEVTELLFIYNALVRPLAVQWLKDIYEPNPPPENNDAQDKEHRPLDDAEADTPDAGCEDDDERDEDVDEEDDEAVYEDVGPNDDDDSDDEIIEERGVEPTKVCRSVIQDTFTFCDQGRPFTPMALSVPLRKFGRKHLKINLGFSSWRNIAIAIVRDQIGFRRDTETPQNTVFDSLNAHSGHISRKYYALNDGDHNLTSSGSFKKYIDACRLMHDWLNGKELPVVLSPHEQTQQKIEELHKQEQQKIGELSDRVDRVEEQMGKIVEQQNRMEQKMDEMLDLLKRRK
ncbi:hypothetical protein FRC09_001350 [Ceratobasidium sp. 395]|nr:hypothetical protein FRC09_001350 [Ceratobasidium sp. 395]